MDITQLPFNRFIGIQHAEAGSDYVLSLPDDTKYHNHIGSVHASALLSLAEASSGEILIRSIGDMTGVIPVVRRMEAKFKKPGHGRLLSRSTLPEDSVQKLRTEVESKGRGIIEIPVEVLGEDGTVFLSASVEWFVAKNRPQI